MLRNEVHSVAKNAQLTLEAAGTLVTYVNFGLNADSSESLAIIAEEIGLVSEQLLDAPPQSGLYDLRDFQREIEAMLSSDGKAFAARDQWYLANFDRVEQTDLWRFKKKPMQNRHDMFASDNEGSFGSGGDGDDDDDD